MTFTTRYTRDEITCMLTFGCVGITGAIVNLGTSYCLTEFIGLWYMYSACIGIELSILTNFMLNDNITFRKLASRFHPMQRLAFYHMVCIGGTLIMLATIYAMTELLGIWYILSSLLAIFPAFVWNFTMSRGIAWRE